MAADVTLASNEIEEDSDFDRVDLDNSDEFLFAIERAIVKEKNRRIAAERTKLEIEILNASDTSTLKESVDSASSSSTTYLFDNINLEENPLLPKTPVLGQPKFTSPSKFI